jgi:hypothetical protein
MTRLETRARLSTALTISAAAFRADPRINVLGGAASPP